MTRERDYYWTVTKEEFLERLKILKDPYSIAVWNYLQAYVIRGKTEIPLWRICYSLYNVIGLLSTSISINKMSKDLNISNRKTIYILNKLDENDFIIKYVSKNRNDMNNINIYIMGFINSSENKNNIDRQENYFVGRINSMRQNDRDHIIELFNKQLKTADTIKETTEKLKEIQDYLFKSSE